jgi:hypothetical protein
VLKQVRTTNGVNKLDTGGKTSLQTIAITSTFDCLEPFPVVGLQAQSEGMVVQGLLLSQGELIVLAAYKFV